MQVNLTTSNHLADARCKRGRALSFSLSMALMLIFCFAAAQAQSDATVKPVTGEGSSNAQASSEAQRTRSRRAAENPEAASDTAQASEEASATAAPPVKGSDRLSALRAQIEDARTDAERTRLQRTLVDYLVALNRKSEAINELRAMARDERIDPISFYNLGNALARLGDTDTAIDAYRKAINQRHGNYARALNNLGVLFLRQGRWDDAQDSLTRALRLENFRYSEASYNLGRLYAMRGEADLAIREWSRALAVQPDHTDAAIALARALAEDGSPEKGIAILDSFITRRGPSLEMLEARREIMFGDSTVVNTGPALTPASMGKATSANSRPVVVTGGSNAGSKMVLSNSNTGTVKAAKPESNKRAAASLRRLTVDRETYDWLQRAREAREGGRNEEAAKFYSRVLSRNNGFLPPANLEMGFVLSGLKRYDEAAAAFATLANREGARYPIAYYHLGRQYELLGKLSLAAEAFEKASAAYEDENPQFLLDLSRVREKAGNAQAALTAMEAYVRISQKQGHVPDWTTERLAELRQKAGKE